MLAIEEKVIQFQKEQEEVEKVIVRGSDEHLDFLNMVKNSLEKLTMDFSALMDEIIPETNSLSNDDVSKAIPSLLELYSSSIKLVAALKRKRLSTDLKKTCQAFFSQVDNFREFIHDLEEDRTDDNELDSILARINSY